MGLHLCGLHGTSVLNTPAHRPTPVYKPNLERLEEREVPAGLGADRQALLQALMIAQSSSGDLSVLPIHINQVVNANGQLFAVGSLWGMPFADPINLSFTRVNPTAADPTTAILDLHLAPIKLNVLGLHVETSPICLKVNAVSGQGNLLGNLLTDIANLLNGPVGTAVPLNAANIGSLSSTQLSDLTTQLTSLLDQAFGQLSTALTNTVGVVGGSHTANRCEILNLSVGPLNLNLLGLQVMLDNCSNGPVTVDIFATRGRGQLLGNLLCNIAHALDRFPDNLIDPFVDRLFDAIGDILGSIRV
jgi:hypothetical protein